MAGPGTQAVATERRRRGRRREAQKTHQTFRGRHEAHAESCGRGFEHHGSTEKMQTDMHGSRVPRKHRQPLTAYLMRDCLPYMHGVLAWVVVRPDLSYSVRIRGGCHASDAGACSAGPAAPQVRRRRMCSSSCHKLAQRRLRSVTSPRWRQSGGDTAAHESPTNRSRSRADGHASNTSTRTIHCAGRCAHGTLALALAAHGSGGSRSAALHAWRKPYMCKIRFSWHKP